MLVVHLNYIRCCFFVILWEKPQLSNSILKTRSLSMTFCVQQTSVMPLLFNILFVTHPVLFYYNDKTFLSWTKTQTLDLENQNISIYLDATIYNYVVSHLFLMWEQYKHQQTFPYFHYPSCACYFQMDDTEILLKIVLVILGASLLPLPPLYLCMD